MKIAIILLAVLLAGCATKPDPYRIGAMQPGRIISLSDGKILPMQAEILRRSRPIGKMTALDPTTGEQFSGTYTLIVETKVTQQSRPGLLFDQETGEAVQVSNVASGTAVLVGDKGTVLNIKLLVRTGHPPVGTGDAEDNKGKKYSIQF